MQRSMETFTNYHLVKSEDLNHHGTLYAGRTAEWFVESGFVAAANLTRPENIVCRKIHGMSFLRPVHRGDIVCFRSTVVLTGRTRIITHITMEVNQGHVIDGFITFVNVDSDGRSLPHNVEILANTSEEKELQAKAETLD